MNITSNAGIYKYTNKNNGKVYIGQAQHIDQRYKQHLGNKVEKGIDGAIYNEGIDDFDFEVLVQYPELPGEVLDYLEAHFIDKYDSYNKGYNLTRGNHPERLAEEAARTAHMVTFDECKAIIHTFNLVIPEGKNVLFIGQFSMAESFAYDNDVTIISDSVFYSCGGSNIIRAYDEGIVEELKKMKDKHFDLIIANPPYGNGSSVCGKITDYIIHNMDYDRYINCQPISGYFYNNNYKYVDTDKMYFPEVKKFGGAQVHTSVVEILNKPRYNMTEEDFRIYTYDEQLIQYYFENRDRKCTFNSTDCVMKWKDYRTANDVPKHTFLVFSKSTCDGVHTNAADVTWNVNKVHDLSILVKDINQKKYSYVPVTFNTEEELVNFTDWWYGKTGLATKIFKGLHRHSYTKVSTIIPRVDWSHPWTDEEILRDYGYTEKEIEEILK